MLLHGIQGELFMFIDPVQYPAPLQMTGEPFLIPAPNMTVLVPTFSTNTVAVVREEEAFPTTSLVADIGTVLYCTVLYCTALRATRVQ